MTEPTRHRIESQWQTFICAYQFLTRIPPPRHFRYSDDMMHEAARFYPLVGALIGAFAAGVFLLADQLIAVLPAMILSTAATLYLTGAFHEDGFADLCDGIGGGMTPERALEIMKDSRLGTYGVTGLSMMLLLKLALLTTIAMEVSVLIVVGTLITAHALSRSSAVVVIMTSDYVRDAGTAKPVSAGLNGHGKMIMLISSAVLVLVGGWLMGFTPVLVGGAVMAVMHLFIRHLFEAKLGGYTGDCLGATQQMSEVGFYLGVAACI
ncbi:MAG: adenosylcobinamide-GDP ribazoletransferase [Pseudomonadota bacterium]